jgi:hypothetical protein
MVLASVRQLEEDQPFPLLQCSAVLTFVRSIFVKAGDDAGLSKAGECCYGFAIAGTEWHEGNCPVAIRPRVADRTFERMR